MKRFGFLAVFALACLQGIFSLTGCGGSLAHCGSGSCGANEPDITDFTAGAATIEATTGTTLTATFANGIGVIMPGNIAVTSGTPVNITPASTTTYTLTVTGASGTTPATQTTTVTVDPVPTISALTAGAPTIEAGSSTTLTATFAGGTGVITPGNITVTSGTPVTVTPSATTTYTLTVNSPVGTVNASATATVAVDPVPEILLFTASSSVTSGSSFQVTAAFTGGTGTLTGTGIASPLAITSGQAVSVTAPSVTTQTTATYTLTVTPPVGAVAATQTVNVTVDPGSTITSFSASPTLIESGSSTSLTGVFSFGTGVITGPGGFSAPATSGTAVTVTPPATTTPATDIYTLTVTPTGGGTAITQTVTVTVDPAPSIASFSANPSTITSGGSGSKLTAVFSGGTGVVTPGNIAITSGTPVTVIPTSTTTYTLTVTPIVGPAITQTATVTVSTAITVGPGNFGAVTNQILGMNLAAWYDAVANASPVNTAFGQAGIKAIRWPGGSWSDAYHWGENGVAPSMCPGGNNGSTWAGNDTFAQFMTSIAKAGPYDLALTANYGSNPACNAGGDPTEAAAWAAEAVNEGYPASHITVGNEEYGSWEYDLHTAQHDPTTYASAVSGAGGYYSDIKNAVENAGGNANTTLVGVLVDANCTISNGCTNGWDSTVLNNAKGYYDFVEYHFYAQNPGSESDTSLVQNAAKQFTTNINTIKTELTNAGEDGTPIYVGELGSVSSNPGVQSWSITQGLYAGQLLGEAMNDGVARLTWWIGFGNCNGDSGNFSSSLYGWQTFGGYNVFADGTGDTGGSPSAPCTYGGPIGTMSPTAQAFNLFQNVAVTGEYALATSINGDAADVRAYAATHSGGTALVLFNLNETTPQSVVVSPSAGQTTSSGVTVTTYDKEIYDYTNTNCQSDSACTYDSNHDYSTAQWAAPTITNMPGPVALPLTVTLPPWSMSVVIMEQGSGSATTLAAPTFSLASGSYTGTQSVSIAGPAGATICYTTDGSTPASGSSAGTCASGSTQYSTAIAISSSMTLKALATESGDNNSVVATATYTISVITQAATPTISPASGSYPNTQEVTITDSMNGVSIYYTVDGTTPTCSVTTSSTLYSAPFPIPNGASTVQAIACSSSLTTSATASASYTISYYSDPFTQADGPLDSNWTPNTYNSCAMDVVSGEVMAAQAPCGGSGGGAGDYHSLYFYNGDTFAANQWSSYVVRGQQLSNSSPVSLPTLTVRGTPASSYNDAYLTVGGVNQYQVGVLQSTGTSDFCTTLNPLKMPAVGDTVELGVAGSNPAFFWSLVNGNVNATCIDSGSLNPDTGSPGLGTIELNTTPVAAENNWQGGSITLDTGSSPSDNFTRADAGFMGWNWWDLVNNGGQGQEGCAAGGGAPAVFGISGNAAVINSASAGSSACAFWVTPFGSAQAASITLGANSSNGWQAVLVRGTPGNSGASTFYAVLPYGGSYLLYAYTGNGALWNQLATVGSYSTYPTTLELDASGTGPVTLTVKADGTTVGSYSDSSYQLNGSFEGMAIYTSTTTSPAITGWTGQ